MNILMTKVKVLPADLNPGDLVCLNGKKVSRTIYNVKEDCFTVIFDESTRDKTLIFLYPDEEIYVIPSIQYKLKYLLSWYIPEEIKKNFPITCRCKGEGVFNPNFGYEPCSLCDGDGHIFPKAPPIPKQLIEEIEKIIQNFQTSL